MAASRMARGWRMAEKRRALGRGLGALIPSAPSTGAGRPVDVFFTEQKQEAANQPAPATPADISIELPAHVNPDSPDSPQTPEQPGSAEGNAGPLGGAESASLTTPSEEAGSGLTPVPG